MGSNLFPLIGIKTHISKTELIAYFQTFKIQRYLYAFEFSLIGNFLPRYPKYHLPLTFS